MAGTGLGVLDVDSVEDDACDVAGSPPAGREPINRSSKDDTDDNEDPGAMEDDGADPALNNAADPRKSVSLSCASLAVMEVRSTVRMRLGIIKGGSE